MPPLQQDITLYGAVGDEQSFGLQQNPVFSGPDLSLEVGVSTMSASMRGIIPFIKNGKSKGR